MVERPETISDISLDKPGRPCPCVSYLQQEADYFTDELVRPGRQAERSRFPILLGNMDPPDGLESVAFVAQRIDDASDLRFGHSVCGLSVDSGCHGSLIGVQTPVG